MPIANYTTTVDVAKTVGEVMGILSGLGARSVSVTYDEGQPAGIGFVLAGPHGPRAFELPVQIDGVLRALDEQGVPSKYVTREHAARVAWRIGRDWIRAQGALIEAQMATMTEVMLPYLLPEGPGTEGTLYARYVEHEGSIRALEGRS